MKGRRSHFFSLLGPAILFLTIAVVIMIAVLVYAAADEANFWALAGAEPAPAEGESCTLARTGAEGQAYQLRLSLSARPQTAGRTVTLTAEVLAGADGEQGSLCCLDFVRYWPD